MEWTEQAAHSASFHPKRNISEFHVSVTIFELFESAFELDLNAGGICWISATVSLSGPP